MQLKWPNDLLLGGAKLAGILTERSGNRIVVGFGVNLAGAPTIEGRATAALAPEVEIAPQAFAPILAGSFARLLGAWRGADPASLAMAWMQRAHPVGTPLTVHGGDGEAVSGTFAGLEEDGALRLATADGSVRTVRRRRKGPQGGDKGLTHVDTCGPNKDEKTQEGVQSHCFNNKK